MKFEEMSVIMNTEEIKQTVKERYGQCVDAGGGKESCCCPSEAPKNVSFAAEHVLYSKEELSLVPDASLSLSKGCGNPTGFANLKSGEVVVDFGCGAGIDVILAAHKVGENGQVIGVDFTDQMIEKAKLAIADSGLTHSIKLVVSDMEKLNLRDGFADVVISNCVINLCADKDAVYSEAFRILKPGGRLAISDIIYIESIDPQVMERFQSTWAGCVGGTIEKEKYFEIIKKVGFGDINIVATHPLPSTELETMVCCPGPAFTPAPAKDDIDSVQGKVASIKFVAIKPISN